MLNYYIVNFFLSPILCIISHTTRILWTWVGDLLQITTDHQDINIHTGVSHSALFAKLLQIPASSSSLYRSKWMEYIMYDNNQIERGFYDTNVIKTIYYHDKILIWVCYFWVYLFPHLITFLDLIWMFAATALPTPFLFIWTYHWCFNSPPAGKASPLPLVSFLRSSPVSAQSQLLLLSATEEGAIS